MASFLRHLCLLCACQTVMFWGASACFSDDIVDERVTPQVVLDNYVNYISRFDCISFLSDKTINLSMPGRVFAPISSSTTVTLANEASKFDRHSSTVSTLMDSEIISQEVQSETLIRQGEKITASENPEKNQYSIRADFYSQEHTINEHMRELSEKLFFGHEFFEADNLISIQDLLARTNDLTLEINRESDGALVLIATSNDYSLAIWFGDVHSGVPQKIAFERNRGRAKMFDMLSFRMDVFEFQNVEGILVPKEMNITREKLVQDGSRVEEIEIKWSNVTFSQQKFPPLQMGNLFEIPNANPASRRDAPHIEHIWHDGKIVPKTNELMMKIAMGDRKFMPGPDEPRFWLWIFSFLLIALGLGKIIYNIIHRKKAGT